MSKNKKNRTRERWEKQTLKDEGFVDSIEEALPEFYNSESKVLSEVESSLESGNNMDIIELLNKYAPEEETTSKELNSSSSTFSSNKISDNKYYFNLLDIEIYVRIILEILVILYILKGFF